MMTAALRQTPAESRRKYFDPKVGRTAVRIHPGEHYVAEAQTEMLVTVLGSCIAACIRDQNSGIGGMNHFLLPGSDDGEAGQVSAAMRYGNHAMEALVNEIMKTGCSRKDLEIKVFGGANVSSATSPVGKMNCGFIRQYLRTEGLRRWVFDLGGGVARRNHYFPETGGVKCLLLRRTAEQAIARDERRYRSRIATSPVQGEIDLFDLENTA